MGNEEPKYNEILEEVLEIADEYSRLQPTVMDNDDINKRKEKILASSKSTTQILGATENESFKNQKRLNAFPKIICSFFILFLLVSVSFHNPKKHMTFPYEIDYPEYQKRDTTPDAVRLYYHRNSSRVKKIMESPLLKCQELKESEKIESNCHKVVEIHSLEEAIFYLRSNLYFPNEQYYFYRKVLKKKPLQCIGYDYASSKVDDFLYLEDPQDPPQK